MSRQVEVHTPLEELLVEQALLMARELQAAADSAPDGRVLAGAELVALSDGRELTRKALEAALQAQAPGAEKSFAGKPDWRCGRSCGMMGSHSTEGTRWPVAPLARHQPPNGP